MQQRAKSRREAIDWRGPLWKILEAHYFSHVHLKSQAEEELERYGLGLAHHRVLAFIFKYPAITAGELRKILRISNQALGTALGPLIRRGFVEQVTDAQDRRVRHLHVTKSGREVFEASAGKQFAVVRKAVLAAGGDAVRGFLSIAENLSTEESRAFIDPLEERALESVLGKKPNKRAPR